MMANEPGIGGHIGILVGDTGNPRELTVAVKHRGSVRRGEFVRLQHVERDEDGETWVLGRIKSLSRSNVLFSPAMGEGLSEVEMVYSRFSGETIFAKLELVGYRDGRTGEILMPRASLDPGAKVYKVDYEFLSAFYGFNAATSIHIGYLVGYERGPNAVPIYLDVNRIVTEHLAVLAMTGSGKSYTVGRIVERLVADLNATVVVFDPHGEYGSAFEGGQLHRQGGTLDVPDEEASLDRVFRRLEQKLASGGGVKVYTPQDPVFQVKYRGRHQPLALKLDNLELDDLLEIMPELPEAQERVLHVALRYWVQEVPAPRGYESLLRTFDDVAKLAEWANMPGLRQQSANIVKTKLARLVESARCLYSDRKDLPALDAYEMVGRSKTGAHDPVDNVGRLVIIDLQGQSKNARQLTTAMICTEILNAASTPDVRDRIRPVFLVFEEGHNFAPAKDKSVAKNIIRRVAQEGRKFGVGIGIISQRPSRLDEDVTSQCNTLVAMRIKNPADQSFIGRTSDFFSQADLDELPSLSTGEALITGRAIISPLLVKVGPKALRHGGQTPDIIREWG